MPRRNGRGGPPFKPFRRIGGISRLETSCLRARPNDSGFETGERSQELVGLGLLAGKHLQFLGVARAYAHSSPQEQA